MIAMAMVIPVAAIAAPTNKQEADFSQRPGGGGERAQRAQSRGRGPEGPPAPALVWQGRGAEGPPARKTPPPPLGTLRSPVPSRPILLRNTPNTASVSCPIPAHLFPQHPRPEPLQFSSFPSDSPRLPSILFPSHKPPYPKSLLETSRRLVSRAERFAALGEAPLSRFASRERPTPLPFYPSASQLLRGLGAEPPPAGVQGRGRPWPCGANATNYLPPPPIGIYTYSRLHPKREPFLRRK